MCPRNEWSCSHETLIDVRGDLCLEYSVLNLESLALLGMALWGDVFPIHTICSEIWTFGVRLLGTSGLIATKI